MERRIKHSCGHEQTHESYEMFAADIERQATRLARQKCKTCYSASKKAAEESQVAVDVTAITGLALAGLEGSPRQVAWAETIRVKRIATLRRKGHNEVGRLAAVAEAKWWIDHREAPDERLLSLCPVASMA